MKLTYVSIPFKRESVFRGNFMETHRNRFPKFQFPSNGKVYSELSELATEYDGSTVSIPFKRESVFRVIQEHVTYRRIQSFNSLQTGKCIQS